MSIHLTKVLFAMFTAFSAVVGYKNGKFCWDNVTGGHKSLHKRNKIIIILIIIIIIITACSNIKMLKNFHPYCYY